MLKIICKCRNCGAEFVANTVSKEELNNNGYQIVHGTVWLHHCQGVDGPVAGIGETIRIEEADISPKK